MGKIKGSTASLFIAFMLISQQVCSENSAIARFNNIDSIKNGIQTQQYSCEQLIGEYINRILQEDMRFDEKHLPLNTIVYINPFALAQAKALDAEFAVNKKVTKALHCVPVLLKDNIHTIDMPTQVGSYAMQMSWPPFDATIVKKLREQGAIMLAKTAMAEFAMPPADTNSLVGITGNAYDPNLTPGGSSGGAASGVAYGFGVIGIGSDNSGSIRGPAGLNGLLGLRPSYGLVSVEGTFPLGELNGVFGPIVYDFADLVKVLEVITGEDKQDFRTKDIKSFDTALEDLLKVALKDKRIGIITKTDKTIDYLHDEQAKKIVEEIFTRLKSLGIQIVPDISLEKFNTDNSDLLVGGSAYINQYLLKGYSPRMNIADFCASTRTDRLGKPAECKKWIKSDPGINSALYHSKRKMFKDNLAIINHIMDKHQLDALLYLVQKPYYPEGIFSKEHFTYIASNAGLPAIVIRGPMTEHDLPRPTFLQLIGRKFDEKTLLAIIGQYEAHWQPERPGKIQSTGGMAFKDIAAFNSYKQQLAPALYQYMKEEKINTDNLTREKWQAFLLKKIDK
ncbi:MAG: amidase [Proteobacteria bacterium]|nr:amidase [Pseudomonadota bacterium]